MTISVINLGRKLLKLNGLTEPNLESTSNGQCAGWWTGGAPQC